MFSKRRRPGEAPFRPPAWLSGTTELDEATAAGAKMAGLDRTISATEAKEACEASAELSLNDLLGAMGVVDSSSGVEESKGETTTTTAGATTTSVRDVEAAAQARAEAEMAAASIRAVAPADRFKAAYYRDKFGIVSGPGGSSDDERLRLRVVRTYIEGLLWTYHYYYNGVASWQWFYPFHYAPMCSDLTNLLKVGGDITFDVGMHAGDIQCINERQC